MRARIFHGLADPAPLAILEELRDGERAAGNIAAFTGLSASGASRPLACLIEARQEWPHVYYRLAGPHIEHLLNEAALVLDVIADRVAACDRPEMEGG